MLENRKPLGTANCKTCLLHAIKTPRHRTFSAAPGPQIFFKSCPLPCQGNKENHKHTIDLRNPASQFDMHMLCSTYVVCHVCKKKKNSPISTVLQHVSTITSLPDFVKHISMDFVATAAVPESCGPTICRTQPARNQPLNC